MPIKTSSWHSSTTSEVLQALDSVTDGLSDSEVQKRIRIYGVNEIARARRESWLHLLIRQIRSPLVYVMLASIVIAMLMGKVTDGFVVLAVVVLNTLIGFFQEYRAAQDIEALNQLVAETATVIREGQQRDIPGQAIVPGDILLLEAGDKVPADLRLIETKNLHIDESALTGESVPVAKHIRPVVQDVVLGDRSCMAFAGTLVTSGTAMAVAVATGMTTELGHISQLLSETTQLVTPLTQRLGKLATSIAVSISVVAGVIFVVGLLRAYGAADSAFAAITLAVAAIPEGLPAIITIASAIGVRTMARRNAIIRHLPAVETLGSTTVICTDKTGTLTRNEMTVQALWTSSGQYRLTGVGYAPIGALTDDNGEPLAPIPSDVHELLKCAVLCNDAAVVEEGEKWGISGDPTEAAMVVAGRKVGLVESDVRRQWPRLDAIPFDSERKLMATLHTGAEGSRFVCVKGAPEAVVGLCQSFTDGSTVRPEAIHAAVEELAAGGMRVLAIAVGSYTSRSATLEYQSLREGLQMLGLIAMIDPPREEAIKAIQLCRTAGITVKMITGDHQTTARAIGAQIGLLDDHLLREVVTGEQLAKSSDDELKELVQLSNVFARVAPEHKLRLVMALQANGEIVAMTGDGVNDAPALKRSDIGVAMGINGTAVAKDASSIVLADDNFASIAAAVEEGRRVYDNLLKSLAFILPTSLGQAMIILVAVLFFPVTAGHLLMPILPVQILWVNLVVAVALALPLAFEAKEPDVMTRPPRPPNAPLLSPFLITRTFLVSSLMAGGAVALFFYEYLDDLRRGVDPSVALAESQTVVVTTIIVFQAVYVLNCRSLTDSILRIGLFTNNYVYWGIAVTLMLQLALVYSPWLNTIFHTHPLDASDWIAPLLVGLIGIPVVWIEKRLWKRRNARAQRATP